MKSERAKKYIDNDAIVMRNGLLTLYDTSMVNGIRHIIVGPALQVKLSGGVRFAIDTNWFNTKDVASISVSYAGL